LKCLLKNLQRQKDICVKKKYSLPPKLQGTKILQKLIFTAVLWWNLVFLWFGGILNFRFSGVVYIKDTFELEE